MKKAVLGITDSHSRAERIVSTLQQSGFGPNDISVLFPDRHGTKDFAHAVGTKAPEGAVAGGTTGWVLGGTVGLLAGLGAVVVPGLGAFIAAGPLMSALTGAAVGAAAGGVAGALIGLGVPEVEAKAYESKVRGGNILLAVHTDNKEEREAAEAILKREGAREVTAATEARVPRESRA
jgi:hypothetical protein